MRYARFAIGAVVVLAALVVVGAASASTITRNATGGGTILVPNAPAPTASTSGGLPEIDSTSLENDGVDPGSPVARTATVSQRGTKGNGANPTLAGSFDGLNFFDQRFANGGNQFSVEPPDQGLCVGNGKVVEVVNDVYQVFDTSGHPLINPVDLNTLFGYAPAITRSGPNAGQEGPDVFDPSCLFDQQTGSSSSSPARSIRRVADEPRRIGYITHRHPRRQRSDQVADEVLDRHDDDAACFNDGAQTKPGPCFPDLSAHRNGRERLLRHDERVRLLRPELRGRQHLRDVEVDPRERRVHGAGRADEHERRRPPTPVPGSPSFRRRRLPVSSRPQRRHR